MTNPNDSPAEKGNLILDGGVMEGVGIEEFEVEKSSSDALAFDAL